MNASRQSHQNFNKIDLEYLISIQLNISVLIPLRGRGVAESDGVGRTKLRVNNDCNNTNSSLLIIH